MLSRIFPGLQWLEGYHSNSFKSDFFSGITIAFLLIPQGMAYAIVAGLPPEYGLYACIAPPIIYALLGTSNKISLGPVAIDSILIITGLSLLAEPGSDQYLELAIALTLLVGCIQGMLGLLRFGFIANFLSYPVIVGYTSAAALIIIGSQLESIVRVDVNGGNIFVLLYQLVLNVEKWHALTMMMALLASLFMIYGKRLLPKMPCALLLLVIGMIVSGLLGAASFGIHVISEIPQGLPSLTIPRLTLEEYTSLLPVAFTVALMGYVGTMSICKSEEKPSDKVSAKPNQELLAVGAANLMGAFFKAFPVSASFSRSAAFRDAGALTQVSAIVSSLVIMVTVLFLTPYFAKYPLPKVLLSVIIIVSVIGLFQHKAMKQLYKQDRREFTIMLTTFLITLIFGVQQGLLLGVALSLLMVFYKTANPHMTELGFIKQSSLYRNVSRFPNTVVRDDLLIFRFDAPLYFANKDYFIEKLYSWIRKRQGGSLRYIIFDAEAVNSLDSTALQMLQQIIENFREQNIQFYISNPIGPVRDAIKNSELSEYMCEDSIFTTIADAVTYIDDGVNNHAREALQTNT